MRITVLGASGQVGSVIYDGLKQPYEVTGTSRKRLPHLIQFNPFQDDWTALGKADVLINCIGQIDATSTSSFHRIHVELTKNIIAHRQQLGHPAIIQISALGASAKHNVGFLRTKGIADDLLLQHHETAVIRPSIVCTHRTMIVKKMMMLSDLGRLLPESSQCQKVFCKRRFSLSCRKTWLTSRESCVSIAPRESFMRWDRSP